MSAISFTALIGGGLLLSWTEHLQATWVGFTILFLLAAVARGFAAHYLQRLDESDAPVTAHVNLRLKDFVVAGRHEAFMRFLLFSGFMHISALLAGPFFALYLLRNLHLSYMEYSLWAAASVIGGFLTINGWGRISDLYGNRKLLMTTGFGLPVLPLLYLTTEDVWWLIMINGLAGMLWSGFSLGLQNIVYDLVKSEERAGAVAVSNGVIATSAFMGTMLGGWLSTVLAPRDWRRSLRSAFRFEPPGHLFGLGSSAPRRDRPLYEAAQGSAGRRTDFPPRTLPRTTPHQTMMDVIGRRVGHQP
jgi:hypothetical protein